MKKILALLVAIVMLLGVTSVFAEDAALPLEGCIVILHTNDVHGGARATADNFGYAGIAAAKKSLQAQGATVLLMDAGDAIQGDPIVNMVLGANAVDFMNRAGYDVAIPGNHEFDWGYANLTQILENAQYQFICANIFADDGKAIFAPYTTFEVAEGVKIGVFGLDTPEAATKVHPDKIKGLKFLAGEELFACAQAQVDALKAEGCQLIVCLGHLGQDDESIGNRSIDLLDKVTGIDLFIDAHSHTVLEKGDTTHGNTLRVSAGTKSEYLGFVAYNMATAEDGTVSLELKDYGLCAANDILRPVMVTGSLPIVDTELNDYVEAVNAEINAALDAPFAKTEVDLNGERDPGNRTEETNLGDLSTDALLWAAREATGQDVVAAVTNGGGIRASVAAGDISMLDMKSVFPFGNTVAILTVKGSELLEALEAGTYMTPQAIGAFPQVSGIEFTIDTTVPFEAGEQYPDSTYFAPANPGSRITITTVGGKPFDPEALYIVATNDFTAAGGDTYYAFRYGFQNSGVNTGVALEDAMVDYIQTVLNGVIGQDYAAPQGRITIIK